MKALFLLAGTPGSGKSTLLRNALRQKLPLFGEELDPAFQATRVPERFPEDDITFEKRVLTRTWFHEVHLLHLATAKELPESVVVHFDLISALGMARLIAKLYGNDRLLANRNIGSLVEDQLNAREYSLLLSLPLFKKFEAISVVTLYQPFELARRQWSERTRKEDIERRGEIKFLQHRSTCEFIYNSDELRDRAYHAIHLGWLQALNHFRPSLSRVAEVRGSSIHLRNSGFGPPDARCLALAPSGQEI